MTLYPWLQSDLAQLLARRAQLPHALLLHGQSGIGKTELAQFFAQSLLCEQPTPHGACGQCDACGWFAQGNHPDYRCIRPDALSEDVTNTEPEEGKDKKKASQEIRVDQIRALADFVNIGTHRSGLRVVVLYPAQALNMNAANALLKVLEEPPPQSLFVLVADGLDRLLPTILSRCQKVSMGIPDPAQASSWLQAQGVKEGAALLAEAGGAPLAALALNEASDWRQLQGELLTELAQPAQMDALRLAEKLYKLPLPTVIDWMQRWLYDLIAYCQTSRVRYYPAREKTLLKLAQQIPLAATMELARQVNQFQAIARHPLNTRVQLEALLLQYQRALQVRSP
ncbi:MAG: DNA polymerase III subunit delta' [Burkholderiaceae bacterium]|nr:MAG: DNA polymerase III subunit delta' [Burkholderiaceae bacterium]